MNNYKVAIIGAGNMGGSIARGLAHGTYISTSNIIVSNPSNSKLEKLKEEYPDIHITNSNEQAVEHANIIILAVKPWKVEEVLTSLHLSQNQVLVSVAAGISCEELSQYTAPSTSIIRAIPNTAISELASLTLITSINASHEELSLIIDIFNEMGIAMPIEENCFPAATALTSCGIAYVFKYVQAAMQAGTELGIKPKESMKMLAQTLEGAAQILLNHAETHPAIEIDKVTTPGGITIKGVNSLEHSGFTSAIIKAIKESV